MTPAQAARLEACNRRIERLCETRHGGVQAKLADFAANLVVLLQMAHDPACSLDDLLAQIERDLDYYDRTWPSTN